MKGIAQVELRRKLITGIVAGALALTAAVVVFAYWWSGRKEAKPVASPRPVPTGVNQQLSGYTFTRSDEGRQVFTIHAARTVAFKEGGATVLEDVYLEMFGRTGDRRDVLRTRRCDYNAQSGDLFSSGTVQIELNAPPVGKSGGDRPWRSVMLETSQLYFHQQGSLVVSDAPVRFRVGPISGAARGMSYATKDGWLELKSQVSAELKPGGREQVPVRLTAARARYEKQSGQVTLGGPVEISQGSRRVETASAVVSLDGRNHITRVTLDGGVRASEESGVTQLALASEKLEGEFDPQDETLRSATAEGGVQVESTREGGVSHLNAHKVEIAFAGRQPHAQRGLASGGVRMTQESANPERARRLQVTTPGSVLTSRKELSGDAVQFTFQVNNQTLREAQTVGPGKLVLVPADPKLGERVVNAGQFFMNFGARNRLETMRGEGGTRITFQPGRDAPPGRIPQECTAERFVAALDPATQNITTFDQSGDFHFREGDREATAESASYQSLKETLTLRGDPRVWDADMRARAEKIVIDLRTDTAEGIGKVQSTHLAQGGGEPTSVLADRVLAQRGSQTVHYEGNVRAWRGADVVESAALDVFRNERRVSSGLKVVTSHLQPGGRVAQGPARAGQREGGPLSIRAERLEYFDQGRKASYRGRVRLQTENTTLEADRLDAYFSNLPAGGDWELERAVAEGSVKVTQPGRRATGRRAEYYSADGRILLSGGPPTLYDAEKGFTSGQRLTFYTRDDRLVVSGGDESPTISRHRIEQ